jgi:hypothetical protein
MSGGRNAGGGPGGPGADADTRRAHLAEVTALLAAVTGGPGAGAALLVG